ncbi:MAG: flagellin, partial [Armatimonadetes bacterium]|nr:flagellin [Armatimonadota bacterium]
MSLRINTNTAAMNALRNLTNVSDNFARSIERLSSGLRINRGADDPAGLIISENLRAQMVGLAQATANAQDAANLVKTAEGALEEIHNLLRTMRQLAVHAANTGVNDLTAAQADQTQIRSALESLNRIAEQTQFGTKKLLDGTAGISAQVTDTARLAG